MELRRNQDSKGEMIVDKKSPNKTGTLTAVPKKEGVETYGKQSPEFDGLQEGELRKVVLAAPSAHVQFFLIVLPLPCL